jgi:aminopeptidase N
VVNDDEKWLEILRGLNQVFYHQTVTTAQVETYIAQKAGLDLRSFFDQYLRDPRKPVLEVKKDAQGWYCRWVNCLPSFDMPVRLRLGGKEITAHPKPTWVRFSDQTNLDDVAIGEGYYIDFRRTR